MHDIDMTTGTAAVFTAGESAWHRLGRVVEAATTSSEAIRLAGLDWHVDQWPVSAIAPDGWGTIAAKEFTANIRTDTRAVLGIVGRKYKPFQNVEAFQFADAVVGEGKARYETAGALKGGRRVWMLLKLPEELKAGKQDLIQPYLLIFNTFDGSSCLRAILTSVRVVCQNTLNLALNHGRGEGVTIRHRGDLQQRVQEAQATLGLVHRRLKAFQQEVDVMRAVPMSGSRLDRYFEGLLPPLSPRASERERTNRLAVLDQLQANFSNDRNHLPGIEGSLWAALQSATEYADHERIVRGRNDLERMENRLDSLWFGSAAEFKASAYEAALEVAGLN